MKSPSLPGAVRIPRNTVPALATALALAQAHGADWPAYRFDGNRSANAPMELAADLHPAWTWVSDHAPVPAWPLPGEETPRMHTDRAFHVVVDQHTAFFGSSVDHQMRALDTRTGELKWRFTTGGAIRFAPFLAGNRVVFGCDDGWIYALHASDGSLAWRHRPGSSGEMVIGNGRMVSSWPIRTGLLVADDIVYAGAGVFPYEGLVITALQADTGVPVWVNDTAGDLAWGQTYGGMAPQGYLLASASRLYVPSGRGMPAAFDLGSGDFLRFLSPGGKTGGTWALLDGGKLVAGVNSQGEPAKIVYDEESGAREGDLFANFPGVDMVLDTRTAFTVTRTRLLAVDREAYRLAAAEKPELDERLKAAGNAINALREPLANAAPDSQEQRRLRAELEAASSEIQQIEQRRNSLADAIVRWSIPAEGLETIARIGETLVVGGDSQVLRVRADSGQILGRHAVRGKALGIAAGDDRLFVTTDAGHVACFGPDAGPEVVLGPGSGKRDATTATGPDLTDTARNILGVSGVSRGFCLVAGAGTGALAEAIARSSELTVIAIEDDPVRLKAARERLLGAGLYGRRVVVEDWAYADLPDYFANLIVSEAPLLGEPFSAPAGELFRVLRPAGGRMILGAPDDSRHPFDPQAWTRFHDAPPFRTVRQHGTWHLAERPALEGAGSWNGLYGNAANTGSSTDELVRGPLGVLWYGEPGSEHMLDRHARTVSPVAVNGRLFVQGMELVQGYDAYNGTRLWSREIPGAVRTRVDVDGSNLFATDDHLFVAAHDEALQLDAATGEVTHRFTLPRRADGQARRWGFIAVQDGILLGSEAIPLALEYGALWNLMVQDGQWRPDSEIPAPVHELSARGRPLPEHFRTKYARPDEHAWDEFKRDGYHWKFNARFPGWLPDHEPSPVDERMMISDAVFAFDVVSGQLLWRHEAGPIPQISIGLGNDRVFFVQGDATIAEKVRASEERDAMIRDDLYIPHAEEALTFEQRDFRRIVSLDVRTGAPDWTRVVDLSGCGGNKLGLAWHDGRLLFFGHYSNHDQGPFAQGELSWRRISVLNAANGELYWSKPLNYRRRPLVMRDTIFIEPRACSLTDGSIKERQHPITGELVPWEFLRPGHSCGIVTASPNNIFFRSFSAAIVDLDRDSGLQLFGGTRPGCWNSMIPANGLLTMQEASAGCTCSYSLRTTVVLKTREQKGPGEWTVFISNAPAQPVARLALNLGAPGDLRAPDGTLWFSYPRPDTSAGQGPYKDYGVKFDLQHNPDARTVQRDFRNVDLPGTAEPWLFASGLDDIRRLTIPLLEPEAAGSYRVRLAFAPEPALTPGTRRMSVLLDDNVVLEDFDPAGSTAPTVHEFRGVPVKGSLHITLRPHGDSPSPPRLHAVECIREDVTPPAPVVINPAQ